MPFDPKKLQSFIKAGGKTGVTQGGARTGGKGSVRRKRKIVRKQTAHDDKRLKSTLNKLNVRDIPAIEEVNLFKDDGTVIHFASPKVQASIASNTYVVSGNAETKKLQELLPGIINQLGPDNLEDLKKIYASYTPAAGAKAEDDDDDIPELVGGNFEEQSKTQEKAPEKEQEKEQEKETTKDKKSKVQSPKPEEPKDKKEKVTSPKTEQAPAKEKVTSPKPEQAPAKAKEKVASPKTEEPAQKAKEKPKEKPKEKEPEKKKAKPAEEEEEADEEEGEEGEEEEGEEEEGEEEVPDLADS